MDTQTTKTLNTAQQLAVVHTEGPCLIIAGPGSGKTHVLVHRIAHMIQNNHVKPHSLMVLTFTRKAANEMQKRLGDLLQGQSYGYWIGTFHSVFCRILRYEANLLGFSSNFSIYDGDDSKNLIKRIIKEYNLNEKIYKPIAILYRIREAKKAMIDATNYAKHGEWQEEDNAYRIPDFHKVYTAYQIRCKEANAMDYDDLLLYTYDLFKTHPDVLAKYQKRFQYILVDEYQDTDKVQDTIIKALAYEHKNLCVIGDDAQSIYSFRGADVHNILSFTTIFPDARVFKLEQNYRSTQHIVNVANTLIENNTQHKKRLYTHNEIGNPVRIISLFNDLEEASFVATSIAKKHDQEAINYNDCAILYRNNHQSRAIEEALMQKNIPYQILGSISFYQRQEIKDVLAYLQLIGNPNNEEALIRAINQPKRSIGNVTLQKARIYAVENNITFWQALQQASQWITGQVAQRIQAFVTLMMDHQRMLEDANAHKIADSIVKKSGLWQQLQTDMSAEGRSRHDNVIELLDSIQVFCEREEMSSLVDFLENIALMTEVDEEEQHTIARVKLMTIHKAKGLEFKYVYIVGMEEYICPGTNAIKTGMGLEEDRRLFFVAITRAQKELTITHAEHRHLYGHTISSHPSRFLNELDPKSTKVFTRVK